MERRKIIIVEQKYGGLQDYTEHFYHILPAFKDKRYITVNGKILFTLWDPKRIPDCKLFTTCWQDLASKENLMGFHFVGFELKEEELEKMGIQASTLNSPHYFLDYIPFNLFNRLAYRFLKKS